MYITRLKYRDQTIRKLHRTIIHKKQILTECCHLYSATDLHLYELFQTLNKVISTENSVDILRIIIPLEDLIKLSNKRPTARQMNTSAHKNTKNSIIIRIRKIFSASLRYHIDFKETIFNASTTGNKKI